MKKIKENVKKLLSHFKSGFERFPITIILAFMHFITGIYIAEVRNFQSDEFIEVNLLLFGSIFITGMCEIIREKYFYEKNKWLVRGIYSFITLVLSIIFYVDYLQTNDYNNFKFWALIPISIILFVLIPILNRENKEKYLQSEFSDFVITYIFAAVLFVGIAIVLTTISYLFFSSNNDFFFRLTTYFFWFIAEVFGASLFLSLLKKTDDDLENYKFPSIFNLLIKFVIIPLIVIYTGILYIYMAKAVISMQLPKGLISHLVLWYTAFSVIIIILITPFTQKDKFLGNFKKYFPYFSIPLIFASLLAIFQRIYQYGITENRYYVLLLIFWLFFCMISFIRNSKVAKILISLILCLVIAVYSPFNAERVSVYSQSQRLKRMLVKYGALKNGKISKITQNLTNRQGNQIYTVIDYIYSRGKSSVKSLGLKNSSGKVYEISYDLERDLGIKDSWRNYYGEEDGEDGESYDIRKAVNYDLKTEENTSDILDAKGYDNVIHYQKKWGESTDLTYKSGEYKVAIVNKMITVSDKNGKELAKLNCEDLIKQVLVKLKTLKLENSGGSDEEYKVLPKDFEYVGTAGDINYKISLQNIYEEITDGKMTDINYEFYFMFSEKNNF